MKKLFKIRSNLFGVYFPLDEDCNYRRVLRMVRGVWKNWDLWTKTSRESLMESYFCCYYITFMICFTCQLINIYVIMYTIPTFGAQTFTTNSKWKLGRWQELENNLLGMQRYARRNSMLLKEQNNKIHYTPFWIIFWNKTKLQQQTSLWNFKWMI